MSVDNLWISQKSVDCGVGGTHDVRTEVADVLKNGRNELLARGGRKVRTGAKGATVGVRETMQAALLGVP